MSTPKSGWIARNDDGFLAWFDNKPRRDDELGIYRLVHGCAEGLSSYLYPEVKPGECIQIGADDADALDAYIDSSEQIRLGSVQAELERVRAERDAAMHMIDHLVGYLKLLPGSCEGEYAAAEEMLNEYANSTSLKTEDES